MRSFKQVTVAVAARFAFLPAASLAQGTIDNAAVVKLVRSGLSEALVVQTIRSSAGHFDTSVDGILALKKAGVTDDELAAMLTKNAGGAAPESFNHGSSSLPPGVDEVGVYYKSKDGAWKEFSPELVNYKSGGALKSFATQGIIKQDRNGHIPGEMAMLTLTRPVSILIYAPEGTAPNEYQLLKLRVNANNREFRSETGGVFHSSGGAQRDRKDFTATKIAPRIYTFDLDPSLPPGEYGVLPPGSISTSNAASAGKIDTFRLLE